MRSNRQCLILLATLGIAHAACAQCEPRWLPGEGIPGLDGAVFCMIEWDRDGPGPLPSMLVAGGQFTIAGDTFASRIALWDGTRWTALPGPFQRTSSSIYVSALAVLPSGELVVGGGFDWINGIAMRNVARFNGETWSPMGAGLGTTNDGVSRLAVGPQGELVAAGSFSVSGGASAMKIASWDGAAWSTFGGGVDPIPSQLTYVSDVAFRADGSLFVAGRFDSIAGVPAKNVALHTASGWSSLGSGIDGSASAIEILPDGDMVVAGSFSNAGGRPARSVARWNGTQWSKFGDGLNGTVYSLAQFGGQIIAGGNFGGNAINTGSLSRWDGTYWRTIAPKLDAPGTEPLSVQCLHVRPGGELIVGGHFFTAGSAAAQYIASWNAVAWKPLGSGIGGTPVSLSLVTSQTVTSEGEVVLAGNFAGVGDIGAQRIAQWNGAAWRPLGSGRGGALFAVTTLPDGSVIASGNDVGRWNGASWQTLAAASGGFQYGALAPLGGAAFAAGRNSNPGVGPLVNWSGASWSPIGVNFESNSTVKAILPLPDGGMIVAGFLGVIGNPASSSIVQWTGSSWQTLGDGLNGTVWTLARMPNGDIIAGGEFTKSGVKTLSHIARWDGFAWSQIGGGVSDTVRSIAVTPAGDIVACGTFQSAGPTPAQFIARWNRSAWTALGTGLDAKATTVAALPNGDLVVGGDFLRAGAGFSARWAHWTDNPKPWVAVAPKPVTRVAGETLTLSATPSAPYENVSFQWLHAPSDTPDVYSEVANGSGGASVGGGTVSGASGTFSSPTDATACQLVITGVQRSDRGNFKVRFWNSCGESTSIGAIARVKAHITDINADGQVDDADFLLFLAQYNLMLCADPLMPDSCSADFNHDAFVDDADFAVFMPAYNALFH